jgi:hypothetical protein
MSTSAQNIKQAARQLIDQLPEDSTWDDVLYRLAVRRSIEIGLRESESGNGIETRTVRTEFGLNKSPPDK